MAALPEQAIVEILEQRLCRTAIVRADSHTLCVDGTSATCKTTILGRVGVAVTKTQRSTNLPAVDTFWPTNLAYIARGLNQRNCGKPHVNDRTFANPLEWHILWRMFGDWVERVGNVRPSDVAPISILQPGRIELALTGDPPIDRLLGYRRQFELLRKTYYYRFFRDRTNALVIVDSDSRRCDERRAMRNEGSDVVRSGWQFYTELQNLMYSALYPEAVIDLAWFGAATPRDVVNSAISGWIRDVIVPIATGRRGEVPLVELRLPMDRTFQPLLTNARTHASRTLARARCALFVRRILTGDEYDDDDVARRAASNLPAWMRCDTPLLRFSEHQNVPTRVFEPISALLKEDDAFMQIDEDDDLF